MSKRDNVVQFSGVTRLNMPPDPVLQEAIGELHSVVVLGFTKTEASISQALWPMGRM